MRRYWAALTVAVCGMSTWSACGFWRPRPLGAAPLDCAGARTASIETLRGLGYAVVGTYEPMPGRMSIIAAEKTIQKQTFQANVTIACGDNRVEVTPAQPSLARHDPHFDEDFRAAWQERISGTARSGRTAAGPMEVKRDTTAIAPAVGAAAPAAGPSVHLSILSTAQARERFGGDVGAAGLQAARIAIANRTPRTYVVSTPLLMLRRASGQTVAPLTWSAASARIAESPAGRGWKTFDDISRELVTDQLLGPDSNLSGLLLYPSGDYTGVEVLLVDQQSARSERFEGAVAPGSTSPTVVPHAQ